MLELENHRYKISTAPKLAKTHSTSKLGGGRGGFPFIPLLLPFIRDAKD
jgi:hypothetical protein